MTKGAYRRAIASAIKSRDHDRLNDLRTVGLIRVEFVAQRRVRTGVFPRRWDFEQGNIIVVQTPLTLDEIDRASGGRGPWGWGGYTSRYIASIAISYENPQTGESVPA